jgi:hypothetical protein
MLALKYMDWCFYGKYYFLLLRERKQHLQQENIMRRANLGFRCKKYASDASLFLKGAVYLLPATVVPSANIEHVKF